MKKLDLDLKPCRLSELKNLNHKGQRRKPECMLSQGGTGNYI